MHVFTIKVMNKHSRIVNNFFVTGLLLIENELIIQSFAKPHIYYYTA